MSEPTPPKSGGLWARLFQLQAEAEPVPVPEPAPSVTEAVQQAPDNTAPAEAPVTDVASSSEETAAAVVIEQSETAVVEVEPPEPAVANDTPSVEILPPPPVDEAATPESCPCCGTLRKAKQNYCDDCGWMFPANGTPVRAAESPSLSPSREPAMPVQPQTRLKNRYELGALVSERQGVRRYRGRDALTGQAVVIVAGAAPDLAVPLADELPVAAPLDDEFMPSFDDDVPMATEVAGPGAGSGGWPGPAWEKTVLDKANHPALPRPVELFSDGGTDYLVVTVPQGRTLWDAWYEPDAAVRYGYLKQLAEALNALHKAGAILEGLRPDLVAVTENGQATIADLADLLPLPLPAQVPLRATLYTAPELLLTPQTADARADLYSFGALLYSLEYLNHPLEEKDFERQFVPRQITERFPDVHPLFLRLVNKTFVREVPARFPTDEGVKSDPTGFSELVRTLDVCRRNFDRVWLDIAAWTTTGMVRTGNEDAFAYLHGAEARQDDLYEYAMVLLCDGMGGYEAGEVAAALALSEMRKFLLQQPMFASLAGREPPAAPPQPKACQEVLQAALKHANREVYNAARVPGKGRRGMGCTAECVYIDSANVVVGHVGDSRTYHLHKGRLVQMTRDQTFVNRMVELGQISAAEAEHHPRKNELQQAIGGQPDVVPGLYHGRLQRGDWVLVCSDGLSNHIGNDELEKMLTREAAGSAEEAARRLLNLVNLRGATDNATIVVVRAS
jgi:serine/threonine protein phosphatase PrpC